MSFLDDVKKTPSSELILDLEARVDINTGLQLLRHKLKYPWSLGRPFQEYGNKKMLKIIPQMAGAGFLSGDSFSHKLLINNNASVTLESAGASLVLPGDKGPASIDWEFHLKDKAQLMLNTEPYLLINNAELRNKTKIFIDRSSIFLASDFLGHCFPKKVNYGSWESEIKLFFNNKKLIFIDSQKASHHSFARAGKIIGGYPSVGSIWLIAPDLDCSVITKRLPSIDCQIALAELKDGMGQVIRLLANDIGLLRDNIKKIYNAMKKEIQGLDH